MGGVLTGNGTQSCHRSWGWLSSAQSFSTVLLLLHTFQPFAGVLGVVGSPLLPLPCHITRAWRVTYELALPALKCCLTMWNVLHGIASRAPRCTHPWRWLWEVWALHCNDEYADYGEHCSEQERVSHVEVLFLADHGSDGTADKCYDDESSYVHFPRRFVGQPLFCQVPQFFVWKAASVGWIATT